MFHDGSVFPFLRYLDIKTCVYQSPQDFHQPMGRPTHTLCLITRGYVRVSTENKTIIARMGDLLFWPEGIPYDSHWESEDYIEFTAIYYRIHGYRTDNTGKCYYSSLPVIRQFVVLSGKTYFHLFHTFETAFLSPQNTFWVLSSFYKLYGEILPSLPMEKPMHPVVHMVHVFINENMNREYSLTELARYCNMSESRLYHLFREETGFSLMTYKMQVRIRHAGELLLERNYSVEEISNMLNFTSPSYFSKIFRKYMGMTPSSYKKIGGNIV